MVFLIAGWSCGPGLLHLTYWTPTQYLSNWVIWPWLTGGILYAIGAIIYALKVPEKYFKQTFDIWGSSH